MERQDIQKKCVCGSPVKIFTSKSIANPGRPYFRCAYSRAVRCTRLLILMCLPLISLYLYLSCVHLYLSCVFQDGHLFKWVEDGTYEEVNELKDEGMFLINDLKLQIENLKEEVQGCKTEMKKIKRMTIILFSGLCIVAVVVFCDKMFDQGESSLVFGKKTM